MELHVRIVAVLFLVLGGACLAAAGFSALMFGGLAAFVSASHEPAAPLGAAVLGLAGVGLIVFLLGFAVPALFCGVGLLSHRPWARLIGIVLAAISLLRVPIGTALGVYALWVLLNKRSEPLFDGSNGASA
jgi:hypothetical protein